MADQPSTQTCCWSVVKGIHHPSCANHVTPEPFFSQEYRSAIDKLERFGKARNRVHDREVRSVVITDDEALALLVCLKGGGR